MNKPITIDSFIDKESRITIQSTIDSSLSDIVKNYPDPQERKILERALFPGRRLRPLLFYTLLDNKTCLSQSPFLDIAVCIELCHRASIILDDLIDNDLIRRGNPTFPDEYGIERTSLIVVALIGVATERLNRIPHRAVTDISIEYSKTFQNMSWGELSDITAPNGDDDPIQYYKNRVLPKTSELFSFLFRSAAILKELPIKSQRTFATIGRHVGNIYQMHNDIYDVLNARSTERGESDNSKLTVSLPIAVALASCSAKDRIFLSDAIGKTISFSNLKKLESIIHSSLISQSSLDIAQAETRKTLALINKLVDGDSAHQLIGFCNWIQEKQCWDQAEFSRAGY